MRLTPKDAARLLARGDAHVTTPAEPRRARRELAGTRSWTCLTNVAGFYPCGEVLNSWAACERHANTDHDGHGRFECDLEQRNQ